MELQLRYFENNISVYIKVYHNVLELKFQHFYGYVCDDNCNHNLDYIVEFELRYVEIYFAVYNEEYFLDIELELQLPYLRYYFSEYLADYQLELCLEYKLLTRSLQWRRCTFGCISLFYFNFERKIKNGYPSYYSSDCCTNIHEYYCNSHYFVDNWYDDDLGTDHRIQAYRMEYFQDYSMEHFGVTIFNRWGENPII